jgi:hypothetical protein
MRSIERIRALVAGLPQLGDFGHARKTPAGDHRCDEQTERRAIARPLLHW